jgi:hypothetical protein
MTDFGIVHYLPTEGNPVYLKQQHLAAGYCVPTHVHKHDHWGLLGSGQALVELDGVIQAHEGPCVVEIKAGKVHKITALTPITWFCIHASTETDVDKIDQTLIREG